MSSLLKEVIVIEVKVKVEILEVKVILVVKQIRDAISCVFEEGGFC
jgi:hypothetical protein